MTTADLLLLVRRRWVVFLAGLLLTTAAAFGALRDDGVYAASCEVVFLSPPTAARPNSLESASASVIALAGLVERIVNRGEPPSPLSGAVTLAGQGVRDGYSVELPDSGGQWAQNFDKPVLRVQVVGPSADEVAARIRRLTEEVEQTTRQLQRDAGALGPLVRTSVSPAEPPVAHLSGHRSVGLAALVAEGMALSVLLACLLDVLGRRRRDPVAGASRSSALRRNLYSSRGSAVPSQHTR